MDTWTLGITLLVVGMGGTLATLAFMSFIMAVLKRLFPYRPEDEEGK